jgi:hypothetical protein
VLSREEFLAFNVAWIDAVVAHLIEGGVFGTYIDWRGLPTVNASSFVEAERCRRT